MDFDGDGQADILSGSYSPGDLYVFRGNADGSFQKGAIVTGGDNSPVRCGAAAHVFAVDFENRGALDLIVGNIEGQVQFVRNDGTSLAPKFQQPAPLNAGGAPIKLNGDAGPTVADWDGDGAIDLLVGDGRGRVVFYRNTAGPKQAPKFATGKDLLPASGTPGRSPTPIPWGMRLKPHVADFNGDGRLDLLVGDFNSKQVEQKPADPSAMETARQRITEATRAFERANRELRRGPANETPEARAQREAKYKAAQDELQAAGRAYQQVQPVRFENHGYVWLFLRKPVNQGG